MPTIPIQQIRSNGFCSNGSHRDHGWLSDSHQHNHNVHINLSYFLYCIILYGAENLGLLYSYTGSESVVLLAVACHFACWADW